MAVALDVSGPFPVIHDNSSVTTFTSNNGTITTGSNLAVIAFLMIANQSATSHTMVLDSTGTNQSLTKICTLNVGVNVQLTVWAILNPTPVTSKPLLANWTNAGAVGLYGTGLAGVDQGSVVTSFVQQATNSGIGTTTSVVIPSQTNDLTMDFTAADSPLPSMGSPTKTQLAVDNGMNNQVFGTSTASGAASNTHQWTMSTIVPWGAIGLNVFAVGQVSSGGAPLISGGELTKGPLIRGGRLIT